MEPFAGCVLRLRDKFALNLLSSKGEVHTGENALGVDDGEKDEAAEFALARVPKSRRVT